MSNLVTYSEYDYCFSSFNIRKTIQEHEKFYKIKINRNVNAHPQANRKREEINLDKINRKTQMTKKDLRNTNYLLVENSNTKYHVT